MPNEMWDEIIYPFTNNGCTVEVLTWVSNFIPHFIMDVIIYPGRRFLAPYSRQTTGSCHVNSTINGTPRYRVATINTLRPRQNGGHFPDDIFKRIFLNENGWISIEISVKFVLKAQIDNIPALAQIIAWCRIGDKPLSEPKVTRPQRVNSLTSDFRESLD